MHWSDPAPEQVSQLFAAGHTTQAEPETEYFPAVHAVHAVETVLAVVVVSVFTGQLVQV